MTTPRPTAAQTAAAPGGGGPGGGAPGSGAPPTVWSLGPSAFLPALVFEVGTGACDPVLALTALDLGAPVGLAALLLALPGLGRVVANAPAARVVTRIGERRAMALASGLSVAAAVACALATHLAVLAAALLVQGFVSSVFYLARQTYVGDVVPVQMRARALSTLAGAHRIGLFVGPFAGAAAIAVGGMRAAYVVAALASIATVVVLLVVPDLPAAAPAAAPVTADAPPAHDAAVARGASAGGGRDERPWTQFVAHRALFTRLGPTVLAVGAVRAARGTVLPLWAGHLGLDAGTTSLVFGVANALEMVMFYPSGAVMDRRGRLWVALPAMVLLGGAMMLLPTASAVPGLTAVAVAMGVGNGIGSGIMMTLGSDAAPARGRTAFLSVWRVFGDTGNALGPVLVSAVGTVLGLGAGIAVAGATGLVAAAGLARWAPRYTPYATRGARGDA